MAQKLRVQGPMCTHIYFSFLYTEHEDLEGLADFKTGGKVIRTLKYADEFVLLAKEETVVQGMSD
jgi:hypothetical protein